MNKPLFELRADATLDRVRATYAERGTQYGDSWRHGTFLTFKSVAKKLGYNIADEHVRAMVFAGLVDTKHNRQDGGYKDDTLIDGIAYTAALADEMKSLEPKPPS